MKHSTIALLITSTLSINAIAADNQQARGNQYIDNTASNNLSGWKAMVTNATPHKVVASGQWFNKAEKTRSFNQDKQIPLSKEMLRQLSQNSTDALLIIKDNKIISDYYRYGFAKEDIHLIHSAGKAFTSFACEDVYNQGNKTLNQPLSNYLPKLKGTYTGEATLAQSLNMTIATEWSENYEDPNSATMISGAIGGWDPIDAPKSWYSMLNQPKIGKHGKTFSYNSGSVIAASFACSEAANKGFSTLVQDSYEKLGFEYKSYYVSNQLGELSAEGGQAMSIIDFVKIGRYMLENKDSQYVKDIWEMDDSVRKLMSDKYSFAQGYKNYWYKLSDNVIAAIGSGGQLLYINKEKNLIMGKFSSFNQGQGMQEFGQAFEILNELDNLH